MNGLLIVTALILAGLAAGGVLAFLAWAWQVLFRKDEWISDELIHNPDFDRDMEGWTEVKGPLHIMPYDIQDPSPGAIAQMQDREQNLRKWLEPNSDKPVDWTFSASPEEIEAELRKMQKECFK